MADRRDKLVKQFVAKRGYPDARSRAADHATSSTASASEGVASFARVTR
jgi:hypothetical protein